MKEVWSSNFEFEMSMMEDAARMYRYVCIDTEFPGFLRSSSRDASEWEHYADLKFNVDNLKVIQLGLTFSDGVNSDTGDTTWQINFREFDPACDKQVSMSIELLRNSGIDLEKNSREGVDMLAFAKRFRGILRDNRDLKWITFHGLYDLAYLVKIITNGKPMPNSLTDFLQTLACLFRHLYDAKVMAAFSQGLCGGELSLERLGNILKVKRAGASHQAGSDSLLTIGVFWEMKKLLSNLKDEEFEDRLYGTKCRPLSLCAFRGNDVIVDDRQKLQNVPVFPARSCVL
ncbi:hypothetical protein GIB67_041790 [Kingdonia uniflora]|uniref:poly(A)-specific ribonuclease n=1 Tax=Kingdonia uniflora TaxID=39325 RepID=A0A7J7L5M7_9MAGN|nr:hypothetical protein GIB67_041790 [Kingdonia uniflora]